MGLSCVTDAWDAHSGGRAFAQDVSAKAEQLGRPASGALVKLTRAFDQSSRFHETPQVLLMQMDAGERFNDALQLQQSERRREKLEHYGAILKLAAEASECSRQHSAMIQRHCVSHLVGPGGKRLGRFSCGGFLVPVPQRFDGEFNFVKQFVPFQYPLRNPGGAAQSEVDVAAFAPFLVHPAVRCGPRPPV